jgi:quercetin dioxygenase-like cupin family protein
MCVIQNSELPRAALPGIEHVTLAGSDNGLNNLSVWKQSVAPGGATPPHRHDCEEVVLIRNRARFTADVRPNMRLHH